MDCVQPPTIHREVDYATALDRVVKTWKTCCDIAADNGQYVTWEFEPGFAFNKPSDIVRIHDAVDKTNFGMLYDTCHGQMVGVIGARQEGEKETFTNQVELIRKLVRPHQSHPSHRLRQHLPQGRRTARTRPRPIPPFGLGLLNFDEIMPELLKAARVPHDWWTIDLCFWPDAWAATESCKKYVDELVARYGSVDGERMPKELRVGMIGYGFMGRAHSNAYKRLNDFFPVQHRPVLKAVCARNVRKGETVRRQLGI